MNGNHNCNCTNGWSVYTYCLRHYRRQIVNIVPMEMDRLTGKMGTESIPSMKQSVSICTMLTIFLSSHTKVTQRYKVERRYDVTEVCSVRE